MTIENKFEEINGKVANVAWEGIEHVVNLYNRAYESNPKLTSYISAAVGTIGGDIIAKRFIEGEEISVRDLAFTAAASAYQAWLYPKLIPLADKIVNVPFVEKGLEKMRISKKWGKALALTALFFPLNIFYWGVLSIKNKTPINMKGMIVGARTIAEASVPYTVVDYVVANKIDKKYSLPVWSAAELGWNTYFALKNYVARRIIGS
ncbi:MAG: hypothetical protein Q7S74_06575 [Nanoarchaeota archaeon]|nr:hypothetical protein [Nanoarchaeota archaeon]